MTYTVRIQHAGADIVDLGYERYSEAAREFWQTVAMQLDDGREQSRDEQTLMHRSGVDADGNGWRVALIDGRPSEAANLVTSARTGRTGVIRSVVTGADDRIIGYRTSKGYVSVEDVQVREGQES